MAAAADESFYATLREYLIAIDFLNEKELQDEVRKLLDAGLKALETGPSASLAPVAALAPSYTPSTDSTSAAAAGGAGASSRANAAEVPLEKDRLLAAFEWRNGRTCYRVGMETLKKSGKATALPMFKDGLAAAKRSLALFEADGHAHKAIGILYNAASDGTKEQIENAYKIKEHTLRAIELLPDDAVAEHVLGVWCYEVASLGWLSRKLAATFFGSPPESSYEEAYTHLKRSEELVASQGTAPMLSTRVKLAQTCIALGRKDEAFKWIEASDACEPYKGEDPADVVLQGEVAYKLGFTLRKRRPM